MQPTTTTDIEPLLTPEQVSKITQIPLPSLATKRSLEKGQDLPFVRLGGLVRYRRSDVQAFIDGNLHTGIKHDAIALKLALHKSPRINQWARQCVQAKLLLVQKTAGINFVNAAVTQESQSGISAEQYLCEKLAAIQAEIAAFDADAKVEMERLKEKSAKNHPFLMALGAFENGITNKRAHLMGKIHSVDKAHEASITAASHAGLSMAEMEQLGRFEPPEVSVAKWRAQINEIDGQLAQIAAFSADPLHDLKHLAGLPVPGFEQHLSVVTTS